MELTILFLLVFASSGMYFLEHEAQPKSFSSIPASMWWGVITLTTVGYGDVYPITGWGKLLGALIAILGIGMFALPAGILASGFGEEVRLRKQRRKERLEAARKLLAEGGVVLDYEEVKHIVEEVGQLDALERLEAESLVEENAAQRVEEKARLERLTEEVIQEVLQEKQAEEDPPKPLEEAQPTQDSSESLKEAQFTESKQETPPSEIVKREGWCYCPHCGGKLPPYSEGRKEGEE